MSPLYVPANLPFTTLAVPVVRPDLADSLVVTGAAGAWAYGAFTQFAAANDLSGHVLSGFYVSKALLNNTQMQIQVGTGASGSEVLRGAWTFEVVSSAVAFFPVFPLVVVPANARVAARLAAAQGNQTINLVLEFYPTPL